MEDYTGMTRNELDEILKAHKKWVKNEKGGRHADFRGADIGGTTDLLGENQSMRNADDVSPVRHGRWIIGEPDIIGAPIHCSECGWGSDHAYQKDWMKYPGHKFCGACGALMNGGKDDGRIY